MNKTIKIGYKTCAIDLVQSVDDEGSYGHWCSNTSTIKIKEDQSPIEIGNTLIHEILHALFYIQGLNFPDKTEERIVLTLANGLTTVIKDNPGLLTTLSGLIEER